jgi:hypothetical protein
LLAGAVKLMVAWPLPGVAPPMVGAPGAVAAIVTLTVLDAAPVPCAFVAVAEQVYVVPFVNPVTVTGDAAPDAAMAPGLQVTV